MRSVISTGSALELGAEGNAGAATASPLKTYAQGVATNVLNPKIILFFLALLPQFVMTPNGFGPVPFLILGLTYTVVSTIWTLALVLLASPLTKLLRHGNKAGRFANVVTGLVYIVLGLAIFLT